MNRVQKVINQLNKISEEYIDVKTAVGTKELELVIEADKSKYYLNINAFGEWYDEEFTSEDAVVNYLVNDMGLNPEQVSELFEKAVTLGAKGDLEQEIKAITNSMNTLLKSNLSDDKIKELTGKLAKIRVEINKATM